MHVDIIVNRAKNQNFFSLKSVTWKMLPRGAKIAVARLRLCISEVFRMHFLSKSSTFWGLIHHIAQHKDTKFYTYAGTKLCALIMSLASLLFLPKNRATQHEFKEKQQYYG
ncbi:hypothetical protein FHW83_002804 [Duganella sp. SG902]|uniref:hypothetical protein n=1 Tax=Duganella sp. SG902 TaxID=2587016 RepID=UPI00159DF37A|nr:hypothetical protein [Duganella sp. SG902]NVM77003.1 hypothetical protein [Duganella sp. SG902]